MSDEFPLDGELPEEENFTCSFEETLQAKVIRYTYPDGVRIRLGPYAWNLYCSMSPEDQDLFYKRLHDRVLLAQSKPEGNA